MMNGHREDKIELLKKTCKEVKENAYCPYSNFRVGAAVLTAKGNIYSGCNVENCSYGLTVCAEIAAATAAVSAGDRDIVAIAVSTDLPSSAVKSMCGRCRQFMAEFGTEADMDIFMVSNDGSCHQEQLSELLPKAFTPKSLKINQQLKNEQA